MASKEVDNKIKVLTKKRETVFSRLQRMCEYAKALDAVSIAKADPKTLKAFKLMFPTLEKTVEELGGLDDEINLLKLEADSDFTPGFTSFQDLADLIVYVATEHKLTGTKSEKVERKVSKGDESRLLVDSRMLLGKLEIPEFAGNADQWPVFSSLFSSLVDNNSNLTDLHKVSFLISKLSGAALKVCRQIPPTGENYSVIKDLLWKRFDNKRVVSDNYLDKVFNFQPLKSESRENLEFFLDNFCAAVSALQRLGLEDLASRIFLYQGLKVLDTSSRREFETAFRNEGDPSYTDLVNFVENHLKSLRSLNKPLSFESKLENKKFGKTPHSFVVEATEDEVTGVVCNCCQGKGHLCINCRTMLRLSPWERFQAVKRLRLCLKCLEPSHPAAACDKMKPCKECDLPHHSLLHFPFKSKLKDETAAPSNTRNLSANVCAVSKGKVLECVCTVLLSTVQVQVLDSQGQGQTLRFLLDSGSQSNFLTVKACKQLNLNMQRVKYSVLGLGGKPSPVVGKTLLTFASRHDPNSSYALETLVIDKIVERLPSLKVDVSELDYLKQLRLADEDFHTPKEIDGIIGAELVPYLLDGEKIVRAPHHPVAIHSPLGFVLMGRAPVVQSGVNVTSLLSLDNLHSLVEKFWKVEEVPSPARPILSEEEIACEEHYASHVQRDAEGRYCVALPFKQEPKLSLGESYRMAQRRRKTVNGGAKWSIFILRIVRDY